ncbi:right-handed parallel beta-helix repeat-containing protein [Kineosporia sp. NBRC 101731]|uniref:right-handed parallel beta-helix repeat-containing protein n=1 Tax=Kineosporia sp. NBRC 101731 TaxID=3032199 RepID=UPI0024A2226B|nr:right-handed parallel beta-helix repeat-containing protein [Kineosporia sp. NBRC 101731]GLY32112.1 hypothetical protein Kisp02_54770 [Kineosporia sp. NBRC 101731]
MARRIFWPGRDSLTLDWFGTPVAQSRVRIWTAAHGGTQITDLRYVNADGTLAGVVPGGVLVSDSDGLIPAFAGPDGGKGTVWGDHGPAGTRLALAAESSSSGGGGPVTPGSVAVTDLAFDPATQVELDAETAARAAADVAAAVAVTTQITSQLASRAPALHAVQHAAGGTDPVTLTQAQITGLVAALGGKADLIAGVVPSAQLPALAITDVTPVASQAAMLALTAQRGDVAVRTDTLRTYILSTNSPGTLADWLEVTAVGVVTSVAGKTGVVQLTAADITAGVFAPDRLPIGTGVGTVASGADPRFAALADAGVALDGRVDVLEAQALDFEARITALEDGPPTPTVAVPGAPTGVTAAAGVRQAGVSFTPPTDNGGAAIASYRVRASTGQTATGSSSPILVTGLTADVAVTFTVAATNSAGEGPQSAPSSPVTPIAPPNPAGAPEYVHALGTGSFNAPALAVTITTTQAAAAGNSIILATVCNGNPGTVTISDSSANVYRADGAPVSNGTASTVMLHSSLLANALPAGSTITLTFATERNLASIQAHEFTGLPSSAIDGIAVGTANAATALVTGPLSTTYDGDLLFAAWAMAAGDALPAFEAGTGWTAAGVSRAVGSSSRVLYTQWRTLTNAGTVTPAAQVDSAKNYAGVCIALPPVDTSGQVGSGATGTYSDLQSLQAAGSVAIQGDVVTLAPNATFTGKLKFSGLRGTAAHPILIEGPRSAVVDNANTSSGYVLHLDDCQWVTVRGFTLRNGQKGIIVDRGINCVLEDLDVGSMGQEGIHLRNETSYSTVRGCTVHDTGLVSASFGEGLYCGTAQSNWDADQRVPAAMKGFPDHSDYNVFENNTISNCTAECVDIKEGTYGGVLRNNVFDGTLIQGANSADSWVDVKGESWTIEGNTGSTIMTDGFQAHEISFNATYLSPYVDGLGIAHPGIKSGSSNVFDANTAHCAPATGYGFWMMPGTNGNQIYTNNVVTGAPAGVANIPTTVKP